MNKPLTGLEAAARFAPARRIQVGELAKLKLTPEQQTLMDGLTKTVQQQAALAVADKTAASAPKAIGDVLGGNR